MKAVKWLLKRWLKILSPVVAAIFLSATLMGCMPAGCTKKPLPDPKLLQKKLRKASNAEKLSKKLENFSGLLKTIENSLSNNKDIAIELKELKGIQADLNKLNKAIKKDFAKTRKILEKVDSKKKDKIQAKVEKDYSQKFNELSKQLSAIISEKDQGKLKTEISSLQSWIDEATPEPIHQPLGTDLPHRVVDYKAGPPRLGTGIAPAYLPNLPNVEPSKLPKEPTEQDVSETIEVQFTDDITTLTAQLEHNPVKMYEYVKNNVVYEPYYGSRKGANETLWEKGGNDFDQASLLITLYRYCGIPARYVYGVVEIPIDKAMNWVGAEKPEVCAKVFSAGGIPSQAVISGGQITAIRMEHVWTEVYVNYESYRGLDLGEGNKEWIPLDPSFKQYEDKPFPNLLNAEHESELQTVVQQIMQDGTSTPDYFTSYDLNQAKTSIENFLTSVSEGSSLGTTENIPLLTRRNVKAENLGLLPATLQYPVSVVKAEFNKIPSGLQEKFFLSLQDMSSETVLSYEVPLPKIAGKSLFIRFIGASEQDRQIIEAFSDISQAPAYLVRVKPSLFADSAEVATGTSSFPLGEKAKLKVGFEKGTSIEAIENYIDTGSFYSIVLNLSNISKNSFLYHAQRFQDEAEKVRRYQEEGIDSEIDLIALSSELCNLTGLLYYRQLDFVQSVLAKASGCVNYRSPSELICAPSVETYYLFGVPQTFLPKGVYLDVDQDVHLIKSKTDDAQKEKNWALSSGIASSYLESFVIEEVFGIEAVSTMKVLQIANNLGMPIYEIRPDNIEQVLPNLNLDSSTKQEIKNAVNSGNNVTVPESPVSYLGWQGVGYIVLDPETFSGGYMIKGLGGSESCEGDTDFEPGSNFRAFPGGGLGFSPGDEAPGYAKNPGGIPDPEKEAERVRYSLIAQLFIDAATLVCSLSFNPPVTRITTRLAAIASLSLLIDTVVQLYNTDLLPDEIVDCYLIACYFATWTIYALTYAQIAGQINPVKAMVLDLCAASFILGSLAWVFENYEGEK